MPAVRATAFHHQGLTVSDLERTCGFYEEVFGAEREWQVEVSGEEISAITGVPDADVRIAWLRLPSGSLELFEFRNPGGRPHDRRADDVGATHVCVHVEDVDAAYSRLRELGVECRQAPQLVEQGPVAGYRYFFCSDPDGLPIEVLQTPVLNLDMNPNIQ